MLLHAIFFTFCAFMILFSLQPWLFIVNLFSSYLFIVYFIISLYLWLKGDMISKYFFLAISFFLLSFTLSLLMIIGILDNTPLIRYSFLFGSFVEMLLFSSLIGYRFNEMQIYYSNRLKKEVVAKTSELQETNTQLKFMVEERSELLKEIHHRVKNNFQIIISILGIESINSNNESVNKLVYNITDRLKAMAQVHEQLYTSEKIQHIDLANYLEKLINHITIGHKTEKLKTDYAFDHIILKGDYAIAIGLSINELFTNSIKHACNDKQLLIKIRLRKNNNKILLSYEDNGDGCKETKSNHDGGLELIKKFVHNLPQSDVEINTKQGFSYKISFTLE